MKRFARSHTACRGTLTGNGKTITLAKQDLNRAIDSALDGRYEPALVTFGGYSILVFRELTGWCHQVFGEHRPLAPEGVNEISASCFLATDSRDGAIQSAAHHVISLGSMDYHTDAEIPAFLTDRSKRADILSSCRFHRAYRFAKEQYHGLSNGTSNDNDWHSWACNHHHEEQFA